MRYVKEGKVIRQRIPATQYNEIFRTAVLPDVDAALEALRDKFCNYRTFFWVTDQFFNIPEVQKFMQGDLLLGSSFKTARVFLEFPDSSIKPTIYNGSFVSLFEIVSRTAPKGRRNDPVVPTAR